MPVVGSVPPRVEATPVREALRSVSRAPRDVHATLATTREVELVFSQFERYSLHPRSDAALAHARARQVLLLRHRPTGVSVDLSLAWLPFELDALAAAEDRVLGSVEITVARAEDVVIYKALSFGAQDREDIERLVALHKKTLDLARIRRVVAEVALALDEPGRISELEGVIERGLDLAP